MRGKDWLVGGAVGALVAAASAAVLSGGRVAIDPGVAVTSGGTAGIVQQALTPVSCTLGTPCVGATGGTLSPGRCNVADDALLRDLVYFGNLWSLIQNNATDTPTFVLAVKPTLSNHAARDAATRSARPIARPGGGMRPR